MVLQVGGLGCGSDRERGVVLTVLIFGYSGVSGVVE